MLTRLLDWLLGPKCPLGCGQRVYVEKDLDRHLTLDHAGDPMPLEGTQP